MYESVPNHLITYSATAARTRTKLLGLDKDGRVAFDHDYDYPNTGCAVAFSSKTIDCSNLTLD